MNERNCDWAASNHRRRAAVAGSRRYEEHQRHILEHFRPHFRAGERFGGRKRLPQVLQLRQIRGF